MHTLPLQNNSTIPVIGLGTWQSAPEEVGKAVKYALTQANYKHIDCAAIYGNEPEIGKAFHEVFTSGSVERETVFITSKLWNTHHKPDHVERACKQTLHDLQLDYLDLYLMHWGLAFDSTQPDPRPLDSDGRIMTEPVPIFDTWQAMEQLVEKGLVKNIGVANFTSMMLLDLLAGAQIKPAINQIELHPYLPQEDLVSFCHHKSVTVTAYSPLGAPGGAGKDHPKLLEEPVVREIAATHKKTPAQVLLKWGIQRNTVVIPKSTTPSRILENIDIFDFNLSTEEQTQLTSLNRNLRIVDPSKMWGMPYFA